MMESGQQSPSKINAPSIYSRTHCRRQTWSLAHQHCESEPGNDKNMHKTIYDIVILNKQAAWLA